MSTCQDCDNTRRMFKPDDIGQPCDICNNTGRDFLNRVCRHVHIHKEK